MTTTRLVTLTICLCMLLQNALALGLAAHSMQQARALVGEDIELICTGKTMRYISLSATELEGEFVFVSPELIKAPAQSIDCTNGTLADLPQFDHALNTALPILSIIRYRALVARLAAKPYTDYAYAAPLSRAPPHA